MTRRSTNSSGSATIPSAGARFRPPTVGLAFAALAFVLVYCTAAAFHLHRVNDTSRRGDQHAYLMHSRAMQSGAVGFPGDRNRMPAYPFLVSLLDEEGLPIEQLFERAKYMNIARGARFPLTLYLPTMFCIFFLLSREPWRSSTLWSRDEIELRVKHVHRLALFLLTVDLVFHFPLVITSKYAGA
jgi:hypothetical protein